MQQRKTSAQIAREMAKDPAWVCRSIKRLLSDFSTIYPRPDEAKTIAANLANLESLLSSSLRAIDASNGRAKIMAIRSAADILQQKANYEIRVGQVAPRTKISDGLPSLDKDALEDWGRSRDERGF